MQIFIPVFGKLNVRIIIYFEFHDEFYPNYTLLFNELIVLLFPHVWHNIIKK